MGLHKLALALAVVIMPFAAAEAQNRLPTSQAYELWLMGPGGPGPARVPNMAVSDAPQELRAKRRDLRNLQRRNPSSGAYGIPQALPRQKMNRGGMGPPAMRGIGGMRGRR
jgi:hypothetical protein